MKRLLTNVLERLLVDDLQPVAAVACRHSGAGNAAVRPGDAGLQLTAEVAVNRAACLLGRLEVVFFACHSRISGWLLFGLHHSRYGLSIPITTAHGHKVVRAAPLAARSAWSIFAIEPLSKMPR